MSIILLRESFLLIEIRNLKKGEKDGKMISYLLKEVRDMFEQLKKNKQLWLNSLSLFIVGVGLIFIYYLLKNLGIITDQLHTFILLIRPVIIAFGVAYVLNRPMIYIEQQLKNLGNPCVKNLSRVMQVTPN